GETSIYRLGFGLNLDAQDRLEQSDLTDLSAQFFSEQVLTDFRSDEGEVTFDYEKRLSSDITARVLALQTIERDITAATSTTGAGLYDSREEALSGETIVRLAGSFTPSPQITTETSLELAHNFLDKQTSLSLNDAPVDLPSANVLVKEQRGEASVSARWRASRAVIVEAALAGEISSLTQSGDVEKSKSFQFIKPRTSVTITPADAWQVRAVAERIAGQLNFDDYASSPSLETGDVSVGNPDLTPETSWRFEAAVERTFWERGAVTLTLSHAEVRDVIDLVPIDNRFDAPGNIGDGVRDEISLALTAPLDRLGAPRTNVRFNGVWRMSEVTDPVSLTARRISKERPFTGDVQVTREFPSLNSSAGLELFFGYSETSYRLNEIRIERASSDPLARLYWTWAPRPDLSVRVQLENFTFRNRSRERILFDGGRAEGTPFFRENRTAIMDPFVFARIRKTF
ncbi:MAG: TonB-dependent receptor, partial [Amphiplicatus sp.]